MSLTGSSALTRAEQDLSVNIKKATSTDESAPKRKHVRACIVYSWDHRSGRAFWNGIKLQPLHGDEIQVFKALITVHKVLQEGHMAVLKEAQAHVNWIESLGRGTGGNYSKLIHEYVRLLLKKLQFHKNYPSFNGTFEYEEYISLRTINDPNEGYEAIMDLMNLQDAIDDFQRLVFSNISHGRSNECKISSLTPMVAESYGIYRFSTSMLRAMHSTTNSEDALEPLRSRFYSQYRRLQDFYYDCSSLKYLTSLITIPKLANDPPNLFGENEDDDQAPALPKRPQQQQQPSQSQTPQPIEQQSTNNNEPESMSDWWGQNDQQQYEQEQLQLQQQREAEIQRQQMLAMQQQQEFEEQQRLQQEQQRQAQEALMRDQMQRQAQGKVAELERDLLNLKGQYDQNQLMLEQYDQRVKSLESELSQINSNNQLQLQSKNELIESLQEQVSMWKSKYESLAKLYSQLRQEHLDLLQKFKQTQAKAASAQEAIDKRERLERDLKSKNLELADLIRERDRARYDLDKAKGGHEEKIEQLERDLRLAQDKINDAERSKGSDLSLMISKHNRELEEMEKALKAKQFVIDDYAKNGSVNTDLEQKLRDKEDELDVMQENMDEMENMIKELNLNSSNSTNLDNIIDAILQSGYERVQESLFEFESPMQTGNWNSTPNYLLSVIEKTSANGTDFATAFNSLIAEEENYSDHSELIKTVTTLSSCISDILINSKGLTRLTSTNDENMADQIINTARECAVQALLFFSSLYTDQLKELNTDEKMELVIGCNYDLQSELQNLSKLAEKLAPTTDKSLTNNNDLGDVVDKEMEKVANAIESATDKLNSLKANASYSSFDVKVHDAILSAAIAVTSAIAGLIRAATECQQEIVSEGRGTQSRNAYLKKHNRWTEGLISAAKAVANSTNILITTADGVLKPDQNIEPEQLIAASNEVAASTAQLVAASRVKASFMSQTQQRLETSSKTVNTACRALVAKVQEILSSSAKGEKDKVDYSKLSRHEFRTTAMEQQVEVLKLETQLEKARSRLFEIRKLDYVDDGDEE